MEEPAYFTCKKCGVQLPTYAEFNDHVLMHFDEEGGYPLDDDDDNANPVGTPEGGEEDDDDPFLVRCPYPGCTVRTETYNFPQHVYETHESFHTQNFSCPICRITGANTPITPDFNLVEHLKSVHSDMIPDAPVNLKGEGIYTRQDIIIDKSLDGDKTCPFCLGEFHSSEKVTILGCMCMYHEECYNDYIRNYPNLPCIIHSQNN